MMMSIPLTGKEEVKIIRFPNGHKRNSVFEACRFKSLTKWLNCVINGAQKRIAERKLDHCHNKGKEVMPLVQPPNLYSSLETHLSI